MKALLLAARLEFVLARRRRVLRVAAHIVGALLCVGFTLELLRYHQARQVQLDLQQRVDAEWRNQPDRHPHRASHFGTYAFRPPGPLGYFDPGLESHSGSMTFLEPHRRNFPSFSEAAASGELLRFGRPSAAFVLQVLLPLLLLCATFASVAGEREGGTWSLAIASGASTRALLLGKALGVLGAVLSCVAPLVLLGLLAGVASGWVDPTWDTLLRLVLLAVVYMLYLAGCALLGVLLSSLHRHPQSALLSALSVWVALWVILPRLVATLAADVHPAPARSELEARIAHAVRSHGDSHNPDNPHFAELRAKTLQKYGVERVHELPVNYGGVVMKEAEAVSSKEFAAFHQSLADAHRAQDSHALAWGLYTPLLSVRAVSMALAGTDTRHMHHFDAEADDYRYRFVQRLNDLHATKIHWENDREQRVDRAEWSKFPTFEPRVPSVGWSLTHALLPATGLLVWGMLAALALLVRSSQRSLQQ